MATSSFNKEFVIQDDRAATAMLEAMDKPTASKHINQSNFSKELESGRSLLKKRFSH